MDFNAVLEKCGNYNRYQFTLLLVFGFTNWLASVHYFTQTIITFTPEHWCYHADLSQSSFDDIRAAYADAEYPSCTTLEDVEGNVTDADDKDRCYRWIYNYESGYESLSTELDWVCDKKYQSAVGQSFFFVGSVVGTIFFGFLSDKFGRLPILLLSSLSGGLGDFLTSFVYTLPTFAASRFVAGLSTDTMYYLMYILVFEYLRPSKRTFGLNVTVVFYMSGMMAGPWLAIWMGNWRAYLRLASLPVAAVLLYPILVCESAHWLVTKNRIAEATKCLKRVAKFNGKQVDDRVFDEFEVYYSKKVNDESVSKSGTKDNFMGMFQTPRLRKFTIILLIKSMIITLSYDVTSRNMEGLGISPFKLFSYTSAVYLPVAVLIMLLQNTIGRKGMACGSLLLGSLIATANALILAFVDYSEQAWLLAFMVCLGRFGTLLAFDAEAQYAAEIIPTSVRGQGLANIHVVGYAFNFLSAYIILLGSYFKPLPSIFISIIMLAGSGLCLMLPETQSKKLPDNLAEGEEFGKGEKWYYFPCGRKAKKEAESEAEEDFDVDLEVQITRL